MPMTINHKFTSGKPDGPDSTLVNPSNWNATHSITNLPIVDATFYGAVADDSTDLGPPLQAAIAAANAIGSVVYLPAGTYKILTPLPTNTRLSLLGAGRDSTIIHVPSTFPLSSNAIISCIFHTPTLPTETTTQFRLHSFTMKFDQPNTPDPIAMIHYPWAIYIDQTGLVDIDEISIIHAYNVLSLTNSSGGMIRGLWFSAWGTGVNVDTTLNSLFIDDMQCAPIGLGGSQYTALYKNTNFYPLIVGQCDGFMMNNSLIFGGFIKINGFSLSYFNNCVFDQIHGITLIADSWRFFNNCWIVNYDDSNIGGTGTTSGFGVSINGGSASFNNCWMYAQVSAVPFFRTPMGESSNYRSHFVSITNCNLLSRNSKYDVQVFDFSATTLTNVIISGNSVERDAPNIIGAPGSNYGSAFFLVQDVSSGGPTILKYENNSLAPMSAGATTLLQFIQDHGHVVRLGPIVTGWVPYNNPTVFAQAKIDGYIGPAVASASTVIPSARIFSISGSALVNTVAVPLGFAPGDTLTIFPIGAFTWNTAGNIFSSGTAVVGKALILTWGGNNFFTSY